MSAWFVRIRTGVALLADLAGIPGCCIIGRAVGRTTAVFSTPIEIEMNERPHVLNIAYVLACSRTCSRFFVRAMREKESKRDKIARGTPTSSASSASSSESCKPRA